MNRLTAARKFAENIIKNLKLLPPIDPAVIIQKYGCDLKEEEIKYGIEAYSQLNENPKITINKNIDYLPRKRFTLAHELGHLIIPWHNGDTKFDTDTPYIKRDGIRYLDTQELEANIFASELLMPTQWIASKISLIGTDNLQDLIQTIQAEAATSIMACCYALENGLPAGHLFFVVNVSTGYRMTFSSKRTYRTRLFYDFDNEKIWLDSICMTKKEFKISQYSIIHYQLQPIPERESLNQLCEHCDNIIELLNIISDYQIRSILPSVNYIIDNISDIYSVFLYSDDTIFKKIFKAESKIKYNSGKASVLTSLLNLRGLEFYDERLADNLGIIIVKEQVFASPKVSRADPNQLLRSIVCDLPCDDAPKKLMSINGIVSNINSQNKTVDYNAMYNLIKYRFILDENNCDFYAHKDFDAYVANKVLDMIAHRKN